MVSKLIFFFSIGLFYGCNGPTPSPTGEGKIRQNQPQQSESDSEYLFNLTELNTRDSEYIPTDDHEMIAHDKRTEKFLALAYFFAVSQLPTNQVIEQNQGLNLATVEDADHQRTLAERNGLAYDFIETVDPETSQIMDQRPFKKSWEEHRRRLKKEGWLVRAFRGRESDGTPDLPGLIFHHPDRKEMQVVFHGTRNGNMYGFPVDAGWSTNLENSPMTLRIADKDYTVHSGFGKKYQTYRASMDANIDRILAEAHGSESVLARQQRFAGIQVDVSGHSQGGASAQLATVHLAERMLAAHAAGASAAGASAAGASAAGASAAGASAAGEDDASSSRGSVSGYFISPPKTFFDAESAARAESLIGVHRIVAAYHQEDPVTIGGSSTALSLDRPRVIIGRHIVQRRDVFAYLATAVISFFHTSLPPDVQARHPTPMEDKVWETHFLSKSGGRNPGELGFDPDLIPYANLRESASGTGATRTRQQAKLTYVNR